ncbi:MAG: UDP-N-acetylmuramoyl-L-alanyl-D-glutamate--2,6-diaminopimelate ligase [Oscillospiraceae bacterium]|nr:UDP-N-acetylmuramoyl-L-alanyl-D-glutamate--2,6-diaminopimelate ligase [Oscillospiraceae bacterium]
MKLKELLQGVNVLKSNVDMETEIRNVCYDSRKVEEGDLFVAVTGFVTDGNRYIPMALQKGAVAVVTAIQPAEDVPYILVDSDRLALALLGKNYYGDPAADMKLIGVTGTNGKTSTTLLLKHVLENTVGAKVGLMGTMENMIGEVRMEASRTTPESFDLYGLLRQMRDAGCTHVVMEVSSHAVALDRIAGLHFAVGAFTNLTEDHLDFHKTMESYCDAKAELFSRCDSAAGNSDDPWFQRMFAKAAYPVLTLSVKKEAGIYAKNISLPADGVRFTAVCGTEEAEVQAVIPGLFTVYNVLTVLGIAVNLGISLRSAAEALKTAKSVKGRVEVVPTPGKDYTVLIDYAHTPDGLQNVLTLLKSICKGRLIAVFGCGGDRDPVKRPIMGRIGTDMADIAIITSDNPRTEEPMSIIRQIVAGVEKNNYKIVEKRPQAIRLAMDIAKKDDIIVLAGKGHETYQEICGVKYHLDEREIVAAYLEETRN